MDAWEIYGFLADRESEEVNQKSNIKYQNDGAKCKMTMQIDLWTPVGGLPIGLIDHNAN